MDALADALDLARVRGALMASVLARDPWGLDVPATGGASFHAITAGACWLRIDGRPPVQLVAGDVLLLPTGVGHDLVSTADGPTVPFDRDIKARHINERGELVLDGPGTATKILCAAYDYDRQVVHPLLSLLPEVLHLPADPVAGAGVAGIVSMLAAEVGEREPGARVGVERLIELLFVHVVRWWIATGADEEASWLRALRDPAIAQVIAAIHADPGYPWTIDELASRVHLSRATLARRFVEQVGEPPHRYLTRWRMAVAARRLRDGTEPVEVVSNSVGYSSEFAFNRAFARHHGVPPGRYRRAG